MMHYFRYFLPVFLQFFSLESFATLTPFDLAKSVSNRPQSDNRIGYMHFTLINSRGNERNRTALFVRAQQIGQIKFAVYFVSPAAIQNTAFLSYDNEDSTDESWLYLPTTERVRRLPSSALSDAFLGTDLTYGDVKNDFKFGLDDWDFSLLANVEIEKKVHLQLQGSIKNKDKLEELGYSSFSAIIDPDTLFPVHVDFNDEDGSPLKSVDIVKQQKIDNVWTATHFVITNNQTGHKTDVELRDIKNVAHIPQEQLKPESLVYGVPELSTWFE